ncbi:MAG TPA: hypothetical protein VMB04_16425 [Mycobacterium sp.]|nr:hypothetical protein [Mycobacterium sp.]
MVESDTATDRSHVEETWPQFAADDFDRERRALRYGLGNICRPKGLSSSERIVIMYVSKTRLAIGASLTALTFGILGAGTAYAYQEHMFNARNDLQQAINELNQAEHDKGGHREAAVGLVQQAIDQVNQGIQVGAGQP